MQNLRSRVARLSLLTVLGSAIGLPAIYAQTATATQTKTDSPVDDATVKLDPFEVSTKGDNSYGALNSNSLTSFNAELKKLPISDDVMTKEFADDVAATSVNALVATYGMAGGQSAVSSDGGATTMVGDRDLSNSGNGGPTARGLTGGGTRLNGFPVKGGGGQLFDVERTEIIQGPQGLLYGASGAGGVINTVLNRAAFAQSFGAIKYQGDEYGTKYGMLDSNWGNDRFAVRVDLQDGSQAFNRYNLGGPINGAYGQIAFRPFQNTVIRFSAESVTNTQTRNASLTLNAPKTGTAIAADPRNTLPLRVLVASGQASDLDNGNVNFGSMDSFAGDFATERIWTTNYQASIETRESSWLSTQVAVMWDQFWQENFSASTTGLTPPGFSTNPTGLWAIGYTPSAGTQLWRRKVARASAVVEFDFLNGSAHNQTLLGMDYWYAENTNKGDAYYLADSSGNIIVNQATITSNTLGRTTLSAPMWVAVSNGPLRYPLGIQPFAHSYVNAATGQTYVRADQAYIGTAPATAANPLGYTGPSGDWLQGGHSGAGYAADFIDWFHGKLTTLAGIRIEDETIGRRGPALNPATYSIDKKPLSANLGVNFELFPGVRPYVSYSNSTSVPNVLNADPVGNLPKTPSGQGEEAGIKFNTPSNRISGTFTVFNGYNKNDQYQIQSAIYSAINPTGTNGSFQPSSVWSTVDRKAYGATLDLTANVVDGWRTRLALSDVNSITETTRNYAQYYNDQFYTSGGGVTWSDGTPYMVPVNPTNKAGPTQQLTVAMLNGTDPTNTNYAAVLDPDSGRITNSTTVFPTTTDPVHGTVFTGKTGLPISAIQLNWGDPNGHHGVIPVVYKGERSSNFAKYQISWTNAYDFTHGPLHGLTLGGSFLGRFQTIGYYYNQVIFNSANVAVGTKRLPSYLPDTITINPFLRYSRKLGRFTYVMQLNVTNVLNNFHWQLLPNPASGAYNYSAVYSQMPRMYTWSSSIRF